MTMAKKSRSTPLGVRAGRLAGLLTLVGLATSVAAGSHDQCGSASMQVAGACSHTCHGHDVDPVRQMIKQAIFQGLPEWQQTLIASVDEGVHPQREVLVAGVMGPSAPGQIAAGTQEAYETVAHLISPEGWARMSDVHQRMLVSYADQNLRTGPTTAMCFTPDADPEMVDAFSRALEMGIERWRQTSRWSSTASSPGPFSQGDPTVLTYSFVPDGTIVANIGIGFPSQPSNLFAFLNGIYGNPATWQQIYHDIFDVWGELCGITYVFEPNDDGATVHQNPGVIGVRGDLRMAAMPLDGNSGVLAYNNFPNDGDMVIDGSDNFYANTSNNSLRLRNILWHEHGHGMGLLHVCPRNETKLMEPFISTMFVGPQHDDIQSAQRHYGDRFEHNDTPGTATDLGTLSDGTGTIDNLSSDDNDDVDYFKFTVTEAKQVTATMRPIGFTYLESTQTQACNTGTNYNSLIANNLGIEVLDTNGVSVIASATGNPAGVNETAVAILPDAGTYYIRVVSGSANTIQLYDLDIEIAQPPFIPVTIQTPNGVPSILDPGMSADFVVRVLEGDDTLVPGSPTLHYRFDGGSFLTSALTPTGGEFYLATLPAPNCGDEPEWFISAAGVLEGTSTLPDSGFFSAFVGELIVVVDDNFETDMGWTVSGNASDGQWDRGIPVNGDRGDPPSDFDGSGQCWLTDNVAGNSDVDDGCTILTSPLFDVSNGGTISYAYWADDGPGVFNQDSLNVEVATDAGSTNWTVIRSYTTPLEQWRTDTIDIDAEIGPTPTLRIRFLACDLGPASLIEAAVDALLIESRTCTQPPVGCEGDADMSGSVDLDDLTYIVLRLGAVAPNDEGADVDGSGVVDLDDITYTVLRFGPCN